MNFICPVCKRPLSLDERTYRCENNHCFDKAKSGYVNLLLSQKSTGHGDDKLMVRARRQFLEKGYYKPLLDALTKTLTELAPNECRLLDSGCGEGWYTDGMVNTLRACRKNVEAVAIDISKFALEVAAKRSDKVSFAVASAYTLPIEDGSCNIITTLFAPFAIEEFNRVLEKDGLLLTAIPLENHLFELKSAVYEKPYRNEVAPFELEGYRIISEKTVKSKALLRSNEDIKNLFMMTPYYYKTSADDQKKLDSIESLEISTEFEVVAYRKI